MPTFIHPALLWGLPIIGVPVLIHLINMLRHRRVEWAAMEFLLQSQKKNRTWIILKQLLLLMMRTAAIAAVVLIVAQPILRNQFGQWFGNTKTHHIVLLDDGFSMSDRWAGTSVMDEAKAVIERIAAEAAREVQPQLFTILRFSRVSMQDHGLRPDMLTEPVNNDFAGRLEDALEEIKASQTSAGPGRAIEAIGQLLGEGNGRRRIVYIISDFRAKEWDDPTELKGQLPELCNSGVELHLVGCVETMRPNLVITSLAPQPGIRAAGVPWPVEVAVKNFGQATAREVSVLLEEDGHVRPAVTIAEIPPGRTVKGRFSVYFPTPGWHEITARLESDAVAADNFRCVTFNLPAEVPVLIVDGDTAARDAKYLSTASSPGGSVRTGIRPQIEMPKFLSIQPLDEFHAINLVNVERLDHSAVEALEQYVSNGGGLAMFLGENSSSRFLNEEFYRNGEGLFPVPIAAQAELPIDRLENAPDLQVGDHFIFRVFAEKRNNFLDTVLVHRYFAVQGGRRTADDSTTRVIARLRNAAPLAVERSFGAGRVVAFLTTAAPVWNNWALNPSFVVAVQDMQAYLAGRPSEAALHQVGSKLELTLDAAEYQPQVHFVAPEPDATTTAVVDAVPGADGSLAVSFSETGTSGIYEALLRKTDGAEITERFAFNVDPSEGDLKVVSGPELAARLPNVKYDYRRAAAFQYELGEPAGANVSDWLLYLLVVLLICEQIVAWWVSYHPPVRISSTATGGVR